jgi:homocysteine S-methyltransferase|tara:strand:+ start:875 stop:1789 length:915 start_codon:yes stop_codon:yes gene_type:complete
MDLNIFKKIKILDSGMGQELIARGLVTRGTLWSATSLIDEKYNQLVIDTHLASINAGADVILTNTFTTRRVRMEENRVKDKFLFANKKACELAIKAKDLSKKNILIAGSLPAQNNTYEADKREDNVIEKDFFDQANIISPYIDFFYLDVLSSGREVKIALDVIKKLKKPVLVGLHIKKNNKLPSGETITDVVKKNINSSWLGVVAACVSLEIIESSSDEFKKLDLPFGFKANLWGVEEPLPVHRFNTPSDEKAKNPNIILGKREDISGEIFCEFSKKLINKGATIIGGCCETNISHIKEAAKLK